MKLKLNKYKQETSLRTEFSSEYFTETLLLHLHVLLLPFIILMQNKHTILAENGENLIRTQPRISTHPRSNNLISAQGG